MRILSLIFRICLLTTFLSALWLLFLVVLLVLFVLLVFLVLLVLALAGSGSLLVFLLFG